MRKILFGGDNKKNCKIIFEVRFELTTHLGISPFVLYKFEVIVITLLMIALQKLVIWANWLISKKMRYVPGAVTCHNAGPFFLNLGFLLKNSLNGKMDTMGEVKNTGIGSGANKTSRIMFPGFIFSNHPLENVPVILENPAKMIPGAGLGDGHFQKDSMLLLIIRIR
jgi:hypothetical protein